MRRPESLGNPPDIQTLAYISIGQVALLTEGRPGALMDRRVFIPDARVSEPASNRFSGTLLTMGFPEGGCSLSIDGEPNTNVPAVVVNERQVSLMLVPPSRIREGWARQRGKAAPPYTANINYRPS